MPRMTVEEARAFNEDFINNKFSLGPDGSDWLSQREMRAWGLGDKTVKYIIQKAIADHKPPVQIIDELVSEKIAAAAV